MEDWRYLTLRIACLIKNHIEVSHIYPGHSEKLKGLAMPGAALSLGTLGVVWLIYLVFMLGSPFRMWCSSSKNVQVTLLLTDLLYDRTPLICHAHALSLGLTFLPSAVMAPLHHSLGNIIETILVSKSLTDWPLHLFLTPYGKEINGFFSHPWWFSNTWHVLFPSYEDFHVQRPNLSLSFPMKADQLGLNPGTTFISNFC